MSSSATSLLANIYIFKDLDQTELGKMATACEEKNYSVGQDIFIATQDAQAMYIIKAGSVKIYGNTKAGDDIQITNLNSGHHFGEMPFLDQKPRSATAKTLEPSVLLEVKYHKMQELLDADPKMASTVYRALARFLCTRLRSTTDDLNQTKEMRLKIFN